MTARMVLTRAQRLHAARRAVRRDIETSLAIARYWRADGSHSTADAIAGYFEGRAARKAARLGRLTALAVRDAQRRARRHATDLLAA